MQLGLQTFMEQTLVKLSKSGFSGQPTSFSSPSEDTSIFKVIETYNKKKFRELLDEADFAVMYCFYFANGVRERLKK